MVKNRLKNNDLDNENQLKQGVLTVLQKPSLMTSIKRVCVTAGALIFIAFPQVSYAYEFTGKELLTWEKKNQDWYFQTSVTMATYVAGQVKASNAKCINDWYFKNTDKVNNEIRTNIEKHPEFHPSGTILVTINKVCGKF